MMQIPPGSWDSHVHVFGPADKYRVSNSNALYAPPVGYEVEALETWHNELGFDHAVLVQPTIYGSDHSYMLHVLQSAEPGRYVGVAIVNDSVSDSALQEMHAAGVRGARFNFGSKFKLAPTSEALRRNLSRVAKLGWFVKVFGYGDDFLQYADELKSLRCPAIIDHIGGPVIQNGLSASGFQFILELLKRPNWWVMLSNGDTRTSSGYPWRNVKAFGQALYETAANRCIWGSDWPHVHRFINPHGHDEDFGLQHKRQRLELLRSYLPDEDAFRHVLVQNPARLFNTLHANQP
jgi:2-pyrone-4,6-dicarboxylate lactonase